MNVARKAASTTPKEVCAQRVLDTLAQSGLNNALVQLEKTKELETERRHLLTSCLLYPMGVKNVLHSTLLRQACKTVERFCLGRAGSKGLKTAYQKAYDEMCFISLRQHITEDYASDEEEYQLSQLVLAACDANDPVNNIVDKLSYIRQAVHLQKAAWLSANYPDKSEVDRVSFLRVAAKNEQARQEQLLREVLKLI